MKVACRFGKRWRVAVAAGLLVCVMAGSGCASYRAQRQLENTAKGWCETIRASQVIPVYPLTEDLEPGDVFLVQTTIRSDAKRYRERGFLPLDDHRTRLKGIQYTNMYFDGYWKDDFGHTPHTRTNRPGAGALPSTGATNSLLTEVDAPRAAFPTYSFAARSGSGLSLALPIKGVPVALNFLHTDRVNGSVTIADARTYGADEGQLYRLLQHWAEKSDVRQVLSETVRDAAPHPIFLRVVSRVYLAGGLIVSLTRANASGVGVAAGTAPKVNLVSPDGTLNVNYTNVLNALNTEANPVSALTDVGGSVRYLGASESSVAMAESFDQMLVIGYLGFDVPVYPGGDLGVPIPTFQRLNGEIPARPQRAGEMTLEQQQFEVSKAALEGLAAKDWRKALTVIGIVTERLWARDFRESRKAYHALKKAPPAEQEAKFPDLLSTFESDAIDYVTVGGNRGERYTRYAEVFARALDQCNRPAK